MIEFQSILERFNLWLQDARMNPAIFEPTAMSLATVDKAGNPSVRIVLLKATTKAGFDFYTNLQSKKADDLFSTHKAALCFHWQPLKRQVRVEGQVGMVSKEEADAYFASRPRESQIGAWASEQSRLLESRAQLEAKIEVLTKRFEGKEVPRPEHWGGFRLIPHHIEFWQEGAHRLHTREIYTHTPQGWKEALLYP